MAFADPKTLTRRYRAEPTRDREIALYIDGSYVCRGPATEAVPVARFGYNGNEWVVPRRCAFELDQCSWSADADTDRPSMCWGGPRMTPEAFLAWIKANP